MAKKEGGNTKVGRDSKDGRFVPVKRSSSNPKTHVQQGKPGDPPPNKKG